MVLVLECLEEVGMELINFRLLEASELKLVLVSRVKKNQRGYEKLGQIGERSG